MEDKHDKILQSIVNMMYREHINDTLTIKIGWGNTYHISHQGYDEYELRIDYESGESSFKTMYAEEN